MPGFFRMILDFGFLEMFLAMIKATRNKIYSNKLQTPLIRVNVLCQFGKFELD
jgi:hypothetical protein